MSIGFEDPWEHLRLLSDEARNSDLIELLRRRAPGATVLEVGTGTGLLACVAARLGARRVYAVEATDLAAAARSLVDHCGLSDVVEVIEADLLDLDPRPVDLAFGELLNADPFVEGLVETSDAAASWVREGGLLAPSRLQLYAALVDDRSSAQEAAAARAQVRSAAETFDLDVAPLLRALRPRHPYTYLAPTVGIASSRAQVLDLELGRGHSPPTHTLVTVTATTALRTSAAAVWFEAPLDQGLMITNRPGAPGHFGHLVSSWDEEIDLDAGDEIDLEVTLDEDHLEVRRASRRSE